LAEFVDEPFARGEAMRLEESRIIAVEDRIAAALATGEHAASIPELEQLVIDEPLRERLWEYLMLAQYRAGRQADALATYQHCRQTLDQQLGIEPGPALRQLELSILQQDSTLQLGEGEAAAPDLDRSATETEMEDRAVALGVSFLVYPDAGGRRRLYQLDEQASPVTVGREATTDLWLSWDGKVSRIHAELVWSDGAWTVVDDGRSRNGSYVNDDRVEGSRLLVDGDVLRLGGTTMTFRQPRQAQTPATELG
jgi:pSer/pThr/pTyr-binding forkhead associated (FHA) protein